MPTMALASPDLRRRHEIGDVPLERALGEIRAELQEGHEGRDREEILAQGDPREEDQVEHGPDEDVRLAGSPTGRSCSRRWSRSVGWTMTAMSRRRRSRG